MQNYLMSVTEREVRKGCINVNNVKDHVIVYTRIINNINLQNTKKAGAYVDLGKKEIDYSLQIKFIKSNFFAT